MLHPTTNPALLDALLGRMPGLAWTADAALRCQFAAGLALELLPLAAGQPIAASAIAPGDAELAAHEQALRGVATHYLLRRAGEEFQCALEPLRDASGAVIGVVGRATPADVLGALQREIAEHRRANAQLASSQRTLNDIVNNSDASIYLKDLEGRYLLLSRDHERLFDAAGARGDRTDRDILPAEVAAALRANDAQVIAALQSMHFEEVVPINGEERTYLSIKFPLRDNDGAVYGVCGISTDITERKRMESELRRSEATLAAVIESSPDPICAVDRNLHIIAFNSVLSAHLRNMFGRVPETGSPRSLAPPADLVARWTARFRRALEGERFEAEEELSIAGVTHRFLVSLNPTLQDGQVTGVTVFGKDITELRRIEQQARQHQAELAHVLRLHTMGELAASLAHEVNQPLGAIANYAQGSRRRLEAGDTDPAELLPMLTAIANEALRAGEITRRVRELLRKAPSVFAVADAAAIVHAAVHIAEATARAAHVVLQVEAPADLPKVRIDVIQIEQVVLNLLLNAIEATAPTRQRTVAVHLAAVGPEAVEIAVHDHGVGIDPAVAPHIFDPFMTTKVSGLGMGLAISRSIVAAHGGQLSASSDSEHGTTFRFTVPTAGLPAMSRA